MRLADLNLQNSNTLIYILFTTRSSRGQHHCKCLIQIFVKRILTPFFKYRYE